MFDLPIIITLILGFAILLGFLNKKLSKPQSTDQQTLITWLTTMQHTMDTTQRTLNEALNSSSNHMVRTLQENSRELNARLDKAAAVMKEVGVEVGQMSEIGRSMKELQSFLKSPKLRGNIGEEVLKDLITQMFPKNSFNLQYQFSSGDRVDAAITTDAGILPIDAKFPMEQFQKMIAAENDVDRDLARKAFVRDVKGHIDAIAKKYILPQEGTMDFALMYLPSESVYYEVVNLTELMTYAKKSRVYVVSPSTLYAHLQTILLSFEGKKLESKSKEVFRLLRSLQIDYEKVNENMGVLGRHLGNAQAQFSNVTTGFMQLGQKIASAKTIDETVAEELEEAN